MQTVEFDSPYPALWREHVACDDGALPGSCIDPETMEVTDHAVSFLGQLRLGQAPSGLLANRERIAWALVLTDTSRLVIDRPEHLNIDRFRIHVRHEHA